MSHRGRGRGSYGEWSGSGGSGGYGGRGGGSGGYGGRGGGSGGYGGRGGSEGAGGSGGWGKKWHKTGRRQEWIEDTSPSGRSPGYRSAQSGYSDYGQGEQYEHHGQHSGFQAGGPGIGHLDKRRSYQQRGAKSPSHSVPQHHEDPPMPPEPYTGADADLGVERKLSRNYNKDRDVEVLAQMGFNVVDKIETKSTFPIFKGTYAEKGANLCGRAVGDEFVAKFFNFWTVFNNNPAKKEQYQTERYVMKTVKHPNLLQYRYDIGFGDTDLLGFMHNPLSKFYSYQRYYLIMDLGIDFNTYRNDERPFTEGLCCSFCVQLYSGLEYLHRQNISHSDAHINNILLFKETDASNGSEEEILVLKWMDFGLSHVFDGIHPAQTEKRERAGKFQGDMESLARVLSTIVESSNISTVVFDQIEHIRQKLNGHRLTSLSNIDPLFQLLRERI